MNEIIFCDPVEVDAKFPPTMMPVVFSNEGFKLLGTMLIANGEGPHPVVLLMHGFPGNEKNLDLAHAIRRAGFNVMIFHYRGTWGSEGVFSFSAGLSDADAAIAFLMNEKNFNRYRINGQKIIIAGHSFGGFCALMKGAEYDLIGDVISTSGFNFGGFAPYIENNEFIREKTLEGLHNGSLMLSSSGPQNLLNEILKNKHHWNIHSRIAKFANKNVLLIGAKRDMVAPIDLHHNPLVNSFNGMGISLEHHILESGHSFSERRIKLAEIIIRWLNRL